MAGRTTRKFRRHAVLGLEVDHTTGHDRCSRCNEPLIPEGDVPLMLWDQSGRRMWVYCLTCSNSMSRRLVPRRDQGSVA